MSVLKQWSRGRLLWRSAPVYLQFRRAKWMSCKKQTITPKHTVGWISKRCRRIRLNSYPLNPPSQPLQQPEQKSKRCKTAAHNTSRARNWHTSREKSAQSIARPATWAHFTIKRRIINFKLWPFQLSILKILLALSSKLQCKCSKSTEMAQEMNRG